MISAYNGYYRTKLTAEEKAAFKKLAISEGSVIEIHDRLLREYIARNQKEENSERSDSRD